MGRKRDSRALEEGAEQAEKGVTHRGMEQRNPGQGPTPPWAHP